MADCDNFDTFAGTVKGRADSIAVIIQSITKDCLMNLKRMAAEIEEKDNEIKRLKEIVDKNAAIAEAGDVHTLPGA